MFQHIAMKKILLLIVLFSIKHSANAQDGSFPVNTNIYLVRHAEKESGNDPLLTEAGRKRAGDLARTLKDKNIQRVYITKYRRTQMTADSMRVQLGIDTVHYLADTTGEDLVNKLKKNNDLGKTILVIGHSNTIPKIIRALGVPDYLANDIPDNEFDNLFLVSYTENKAVLTKKKYGSASQPSATMDAGH
jgi:phosphohistidine phosphatase SixA